ncbi:MAG TPA: hypothetical protein P5550_08995 [Bacteroidales bacterium]|nr:hypothetical protein [Bacteroidales bacterium]
MAKKAGEDSQQEIPPPIYRGIVADVIPKEDAGAVLVHRDAPAPEGGSVVGDVVERDARHAGEQPGLALHMQPSALVGREVVADIVAGQDSLHRFHHRHPAPVGARVLGGVAFDVIAQDEGIGRPHIHPAPVLVGGIVADEVGQGHRTAVVHKGDPPAPGRVVVVDMVEHEYRGMLAVEVVAHHPAPGGRAMVEAYFVQQEHHIGIQHIDRPSGQPLDVVHTDIGDHAELVDVGQHHRPVAEPQAAVQPDEVEGIVLVIQQQVFFEVPPGKQRGGVALTGVLYGVVDAVVEGDEGVEDPGPGVGVVAGLVIDHEGQEAEVFPPPTEDKVEAVARLAQAVHGCGEGLYAFPGFAGE